MKDLLTDELLGAEKKKVEGADEISFYSKGSTESVVGTPVVADGATPPSGSESRAQSPIRPASPVRPDSPIRMGADGAEEGLRHRVVASASPNASTTPAATAALPARIVPQASAEYIRFHTRRRQIDTVILGLMGLIFYVVLRRLGIIFSSQ
ncbi:hypothetical protein BC830DRAFT_890604 [Chytriomyces sp. MP71]|nr:hypothetical protein BC830DRAFT_890604 [Chytriomyces sp. MP71]